MAVISSDPPEELAMKSCCCCFHKDSSLAVINVISVQGCSANWDRHQTEECSLDFVVQRGGGKKTKQFHSCRLSMKNVAGDRKRVTTLWECLCSTVYGLGFLLFCVNLALVKQGKNASLFKSWDEEQQQPSLNRKKSSPSDEEGNKIHIKDKQ